VVEGWNTVAAASAWRRVRRRVAVLLVVGATLLGCRASDGTSRAESVTDSSFSETPSTVATTRSALAGTATSSADRKPSNADEVTVAGEAFWCEKDGRSRYTRCVQRGRYTRSVDFSVPDAWCSRDRCYRYDPDEYEEVTFEGLTYLCKQSTWSSNDLNCNRYYGGSVVRNLNGSTPDLYCSALNDDCSKLWYPDALKRADLITFEGTTYVCESALAAQYGDKQCHRYSGGDPATSTFLTPDLYCSASGRCSTQDFPSALEKTAAEASKYEYIRVGSQNYVCEKTVQGLKCWRYDGYSSPSVAAFGLPNLYCNTRGACDRYSYP